MSDEVTILPYIEAIGYTMARAFVEQKPADTMWRELGWHPVPKVKKEPVQVNEKDLHE